MVECLDVLLKAGGDPHICACDESSPLHIAVQFARVECVERLMKGGANAHAVNSNGSTELSLGRCCCGSPVGGGVGFIIFLSY
jgi:hypothetical protein